MKKIFALTLALGLLFQTGIPSAMAQRGATPPPPIPVMTPESSSSDDTKKLLLAASGVVLLVVIVVNVMKVAEESRKKPTPQSDKAKTLLLDENDPSRTSLEPYYDIEEDAMGMRFKLQF